MLGVWSMLPLQIRYLFCWLSRSATAESFTSCKTPDRFITEITICVTALKFSRDMPSVGEKSSCVVLINMLLKTQDNKFVLLTKSRLFSPAPTSLFCRLISSLVFANRFSHFLLQSETVRWTCGKVVFMFWAICSQAFLLSRVETPVLHFPLIMFFFSCTNWARRRDSCSVQFDLLFLLALLSTSSWDICLKKKHTWFDSSVCTFAVWCWVQMHTIN